MSEFSAPDDELLSSHLDGDLTIEEQARLDARLQTEPDLAARLDNLRSATEIAATPVVPLRTGDADRLISAALAASTTTETVTDLGAARMRRDKWRTRLVTVAAGVAALAIAVPILRSVDSGSDTSTADSAPAATAAADDSDDSGDADADMADNAMESTALDDLSAESFDGDDAAPRETAGLDAGDAPEVDQLELPSRFSNFSAADPDFDPLPDDFGEYSDEAALTDAIVEATGRSFVAPATSPNDEDPSTADEPDQPDDGTFVTDEDLALLRNQAALYLDGFGGCGDTIDEIGEILDGLPPVLGVDWSLARVGGEPVIIGLFRLPDDQAFAVVIDATTCTSIDQLVFP